MLRIIATFILIYLVFRFMTMVVFPWIARWYLKRYKKRFYQDNPGAADAARKHSREQKVAREADTDQIGEYVDYEEITDDTTSGNKK